MRHKYTKQKVHIENTKNRIKRNYNYYYIVKIIILYIKQI